MRAELQRALDEMLIGNYISARQIITAVLAQTPIGYATHHDEPMLFPTLKEAQEYCDDDEQPIPLYAGETK